MSEDKSDKWELPEPVFRSSTGELVKPSENIVFDPEPDTLEPGFADRIAIDPEADTLAPDSSLDADESPADNALANLYAPPEGLAEKEEPLSPAADAVDIEPQPMISEQFTAEHLDVDPDEPPKKKSRGVIKTALLTILFLILLGIAGVIVTLTYFYFAFRSSTD